MLAAVAVAEAAAPTVQFGAAAYEVAEGAASARVTIIRTGSTAAGQRVAVRTTAAGTAGADEFTPVRDVITFAAGQRTATVTIRLAAGNDVMDGDRTIVLEIADPTPPLALGARRTATLTIRDDDSAVQFASAEYTVVEGRLATLTVRRVGATRTPATVLATTADGTATAGADYRATERVLTFAPGVASRTLAIPTVRDGIPEDDERFTVTLSAASGTALGSPREAAVTILDADAPATVQFSAAAYSVVEGGVATITVTRTGPAASAVTVGFATVEGGTATGGAAAAPGVDYIRTSGTLTFAAGVSSRTFTVRTLPDAVREGPETVRLVLSVPPGSKAVLGAVASATLTIEDDD